MSNGGNPGNVITKTSQQQIDAIYTSWFGIPGTADKGAYQTLVDMEIHMRTINGKVKTNTIYRRIFSGVISLIATGIIALMVMNFGGM